MVSTRAGQPVHAVPLEVEPASIEGAEVRVSARAAGLEADWVTVSDSVHDAALLSGPAACLLALHLPCLCVTRTFLLTPRVGPERGTWQVVTVVVVTATALLLDNTPLDR